MTSTDNESKTAGAILDRIQLVLGLESDGELSRALNIPRSTVGSWRAADRRPYDICVGLHETRGVSLEWLLTGAGEMRRVTAQEQGGEGQASIPAGLENVERRIVALLDMLAQLGQRDQEAVLSECFARAENAQQLADLRRAVQELEAKKPTKRGGQAG
jgi:hypothetical protein